MASENQLEKPGYVAMVCRDCGGWQFLRKRELLWVTTMNPDEAAVFNFPPQAHRAANYFMRHNKEYDEAIVFNLRSIKFTTRSK